MTGRGIDQDAIQVENDGLDACHGSDSSVLKAITPVLLPLAGADVYEEEGTPLPDRVLESIKERGLAIKGPITTPVGSGFRSINVALRKELDLHACQICDGIQRPGGTVEWHAQVAGARLRLRESQAEAQHQNQHGARQLRGRDRL
ncbi:hypothetical protein B4Q13_17770 [Lacticaseibacillus rhamnosus]